MLTYALQSNDKKSSSSGQWAAPALTPQAAEQKRRVMSQGRQGKHSRVTLAELTDIHRAATSMDHRGDRQLANKYRRQYLSYAHAEQCRVLGLSQDTPAHLLGRAMAEFAAVALGNSL